MNSAIENKFQIKRVSIQIILILVLSMIMGMAVNALRSGNIPLIGNWTTEGRFVDNDGSSLIISPMKAAALYQSQSALFLDARDNSQYQEGHIKGAKSLPWHEVDIYFMALAETLSPDTTIITYCDGETCELSHDLALFLKDMGFENTRVLVNGWTVWQEAGFPAETGMDEALTILPRNEKAQGA